MPSVIGGSESSLEKALRYGLIALMVAFVIALPFMIQNKQEREERKWQTQGCQMYDEYTNENKVPFKCKNYFTDHYAPQAPRIQPPEQVR